MTARRRVLYVEDHEDTRDLVTLVLKQRDFDVVATDTIAGAMLLAGNEDFDLYLLDTRLPDGSGVDLCKKLRGVDGVTPILFFSAAAYEMDKQLALSCGAQGYLTKPSANGELCDLISSLITSSPKKMPT